MSAAAPPPIAERPATTLLETRGVTLRQGKRVILQDISLAFGAGESVALLGRNGAGKTSLLRILLGLQRVNAGRVLLDRQPIAAFSRAQLARHLAYVPQSHTAQFPFSALEMVAMACQALPQQQQEACAMAALEQAGVASLAGRVFGALSGGERQAVLIARALAQQTRIIVMDEPLAALDLAQQHRILRLVRGLVAKGIGVIATLHQPDAAAEVFGRAVLLHQGEVLAQGPVAEVLVESTLSRLYGANLYVAMVEGRRFIYMRD